jgi:hypothetical protein
MREVKLPAIECRRLREELRRTRAGRTMELLREQLWQNVGEKYSDDTIRRCLHRLGYVRKRPRYVLMPDPKQEKKNAEFAAPFLVCQSTVDLGRIVRTFLVEARFIKISLRTRLALI